VRDLAAGDTIPDGPPGTAWFVVEQASAPGTLVLHSTTHVPASWRDKFGAAVDWTWSFRLTGLPGDPDAAAHTDAGAGRALVAGRRLRRRDHPG